MANALAITLVVQGSSPLSPSNGPADVLAAAKTALSNAGFTVHTDGASVQVVAIPADRANPHEDGL